MASSTSILLGPPSVAGDLQTVNPVTVNSLETPVSDSQTLISQTAGLNLEEPPMGLTENFSPTFLSSGSPCLDFFFHIVPDTCPGDLIQRLESSWSHDPLTTLKLVCNLRGVRGTGKSDKEGFYTAALWLFKNHPKTLALNLPSLVDFGYFKDLPEILYRILEGDQQIGKGRKRIWRKRVQRRFKGTCEQRSDISGELEDRILENAEEIGGPVDKIKARALRKQRELEKAKKALERYNSDATYRLLFDRTADLFAGVLKSDLEYLNSNQPNKIGLASKWCPSVDSSYDKATLICEAIARRMFSRDEYGQGIEEAHYAYRIRDRLRKEVLVPLHKALELPELSMSAREWNLLKYNRVASVAMQNYRTHFAEHDLERFTEFLGDVKAGKKKIAAGALLPHQIISQLEDREVGAEVAELQWERMVDDVAKKGKMKSSLAVCDVSGSMSGTPMEVCVALGLLVSELNEEPWKGKVITFSENPELHVVTGSSLREKTEFIRRMDWGGNTDLQKVFDRILDVAVENNLTDDEMIKRIFVFSDMEFDNATGNYHWEWEVSDSESDPGSDYQTAYESDESDYETRYEDRLKKSKERSKKKWETDYEVVQRKYKEKGFEKVPEIVFWNLRDSLATPVAAKQKGVALVSGFSKNLLTLFLEEGGIVNPEDVMGLAIKGKEYMKLAVYD